MTGVAERVGSLWRWARQRMGAQGCKARFKEPEDSHRAELLTRTWDLHWAESEPLGWVLRQNWPDRWVRFHSLPGSKRYADTEEETAEILRRHRTVLADLHGSDSPDLLVISTHWGIPAPNQAPFDPSGAWPWRIVLNPLDREAGPIYCWVQSEVDEPTLNAILVTAADDKGQFVIADTGLSWLYCPYDGGADVLVAGPQERDSLRDRYSDWLSTLESGL